MVKTYPRRILVQQMSGTQEFQTIPLKEEFYNYRKKGIFLKRLAR